MFLKLYISCFEGMHAKSFQSCLTLLQAYGLQPSRFLCPWDSPGKNNGVGCHALLQGIFPTWGPTYVFCIGRWVLYHLSHQGSPLSPQRLIKRESG